MKKLYEMYLRRDDDPYYVKMTPKQAANIRRIISNIGEGGRVIDPEKDGRVLSYSDAIGEIDEQYTSRD
jgi:hypothetical protein